LATGGPGIVDHWTEVLLRRRYICLPRKERRFRWRTCWTGLWNV